MAVPDSVAARLRAAGCVFAEDEARLLMSAARTPAELDAMVGQRTAGLPLEQVLGWAEFCGLRITVAPGVFVPRRRTEFLVRQAVALARPGAVIVDLCCGAGAIGAALAAAVEEAEVHAADIDPAAVRCARQNLPGGRVYQGDLYAPLPAGLRGRIAILWLAPGGYLLSETSERQASLAEAALAAAGLTARVARSADLAVTVVIGRRRPVSQPGC